MIHFSKDFHSFDNKVWLNAASEGPLPLVAAKALEEAIHWKSLPYLLTFEMFASVPKQLKESLGRLLNVNPKEIILGNSASYGLHLLANGIPWEQGDEIIVMQNDFPTNILPWLDLEKKGVKVVQLKAQDKVLSLDELDRAINRKTKLFCISHAHTFSGILLPIDQFAKLCRKHNIIFVVNVSQSAGTMPLDFSDGQVDAVVGAGYKWLCGPYGTGFAWIKQSLLERLELNQAYWITNSSDQELKEDVPLVAKDLKSARKYDVFGTANFFNFVPFNACLKYWLEIGLDKVYEHNQHLIDELIAGLDSKSYDLISPRSGSTRSNLVVISHKDSQKNSAIFESLNKNNIYTALWKNNIRVSPHAYNSSEDIQRFLEFLSSSSSK